MCTDGPEGLFCKQNSRVIKYLGLWVLQFLDFFSIYLLNHYWHYYDIISWTEKLTCQIIYLQQSICTTQDKDIILIGSIPQQLFQCSFCIHISNKGHLFFRTQPKTTMNRPITGHNGVVCPWMSDWCTFAQQHVLKRVQQTKWQRSQITNRGITTTANGHDYKQPNNILQSSNINCNCQK